MASVAAIQSREKHMNNVESLFVDRPGEFLVGRDIYRDPDIYEWEMRHIFEGTWNLLGFESQIAAPFDFMTTTIGRTPVIVSRAADGRIACFLNSCRHKGALVCHRERGSARAFVCQYHGWCYDSAGKCVAIKDKAQGAYGESFDSQSHDLAPVPRLATYRGFIFASLNPDVPPLEVHLGDMRRMIDLLVDQGESGIECVPGTVTFTYRGNWKLQLENGVDPYHFTTTHMSYIEALQRRGTGGSVYSRFDAGALERGTFAFPHGHNAMWGPSPASVAPATAALRAEWAARVGPVVAKWMAYVRNATLFPNAQLADNAAMQVRIWRPLAPDLTEMKTFCLAPIGEAADRRVKRVRQYEEFFNPAGLATPDDIANYEDCQRGHRSNLVAWLQGTARGETMAGKSADHPCLAELGISPAATVVGPFQLGDETVMRSTYRHWLALIRKGLGAASEARQ